MTDKKKNALILFLSVAAIALLVSLVSVIYTKDNSDNQPDIKAYQEKIDLLNDQLQKQIAEPDNSRIIIQNVCANFLDAYYSIQHGNSSAASVENCRAYCTPELFSKISPGKTGNEYASDEIDLDYSSNIVIHDTYYSLEQPETLIAYCTINKNVNGMKSSNKYFIELNLSYADNEWLVNDFELISVIGG